MASARAAALDLISFINASPSPFHAVAECARRLDSAGFQRLSERDPAWSIVPRGKYYLTRGGTAIVAFAVGGRFVPGNGFTIAAGHSDSPCLRVKPVSALTKGGCISLGVETYGGGIWHSWFDRDLSLAGRVIVSKSPTGADSRLVRIDRPLARIPTLAIHLDRTVNESFKVNAEAHLPPILASAVEAALRDPPPPRGDGATATVAAGVGGAATRHHVGLIRVLSEALGVPSADVRDFELSLYDTQPAALGGLYEEHIYSPRLDNLCMTHATLMGLLHSTSGGAGAEARLDTDPHCRVMAAFNHEEVGSDSVTGAGSTMLGDLLSRLSGGSLSSMATAARKSFFVSADMAHALHPNYVGTHSEGHAPSMGAGLVIKNNVSQRYATDAHGAFLIRSVAQRARIPIQDFCARQDAGCGSTIGPIVATRLGIRTVDVGLPQLSMHSCREMMGAADVEHGVSFFSEYYKALPELDAEVEGAE